MHRERDRDRREISRALACGNGNQRVVQCFSCCENVLMWRRRDTALEGHNDKQTHSAHMTAAHMTVAHNDSSTYERTLEGNGLEVNLKGLGWEAEKSNASAIVHGVDHVGQPTAGTAERRALMTHMYTYTRTHQARRSKGGVRWAERCARTFGCPTFRGQRQSPRSCRGRAVSRPAARQRCRCRRSPQRLHHTDGQAPTCSHHRQGPNKAQGSVLVCVCLSVCVSVCASLNLSLPPLPPLPPLLLFSSSLIETPLVQPKPPTHRSCKQFSPPPPPKCKSTIHYVP